MPADPNSYVFMGLQDYGYAKHILLQALKSTLPRPMLQTVCCGRLCCSHPDLGQERQEAQRLAPMQKIA